MASGQSDRRRTARFIGLSSLCASGRWGFFSFFLFSLLLLLFALLVLISDVKQRERSIGGSTQAVVVKYHIA